MYKRKSAGDPFGRLERLETRLYCRQMKNAVSKMSERERKIACKGIMEELRDMEDRPAELIEHARNAT